jgi:hypothetical protein
LGKYCHVRCTCAKISPQLTQAPSTRSIGVALPNGGTAGLFWNYVIGAVGLGFVYASIAELGSMSALKPPSFVF